MLLLVKMRSTLRQGFCFCLALILWVAPWSLSVLWLGPPKNNDFMGILQDKERLLRQPGTHRIILAGGSNVLFGIDSQMLEQVLGRKVLNASSHAGLGIAFLLWFPVQYLRPGDILVISPEYSLNGCDFKLLGLTGFCYRGTLDFVARECRPIDQVRFYVQTAQQSFQRSYWWLKSVLRPEPRQPVLDAYTRAGLNPWGDIISHLDMPGVSIAPVSIKSVDWLPVERALRQCVAQARAQGAEVMFSYPTMCKSSFELSHGAIHEYQKHVEHLAGELDFPILNTPAACSYDDALYFDTVYHLHREGRQRRTRELGAEVQRHMLAMPNIDATVQP